MIQKAFHYSAHPNIDIHLRDFWRANQPTRNPGSAMPSHHWFHYTDVPVVRVERYAEGQAGRGKWDVVHMIPYCVEILRGRVPDQNERKITKPVALILLAHYVADIHQPLHVGAEYFDAQGRIADPDKDKSSLGDEGGNTFTLELNDEPQRGRGIHKKILHAFWDYDAVNALFPEVPKTLRKSELEDQIEPLKKQLAHEMATHEPNNWQIAGNVDPRNYAEVRADEICQLRARRMNGCSLLMCTPNRKKIGSFLRAKPGKKRRPTTPLIAPGPRISCAKNCTKPAGVSPICWRRLSGDEHEH